MAMDYIREMRLQFSDDGVQSGSATGFSDEHEGTFPTHTSHTYSTVVNFDPVTQILDKIDAELVSLTISQGSSSTTTTATDNTVVRRPNSRTSMESSRMENGDGLSMSQLGPSYKPSVSLLSSGSQQHTHSEQDTGIGTSSLLDSSLQHRSLGPDILPLEPGDSFKDDSSMGVHHSSAAPELFYLSGHHMSDDDKQRREKQTASTLEAKHVDDRFKEIMMKRKGVFLSVDEDSQTIRTEDFVDKFKDTLVYSSADEAERIRSIEDDLHSDGASDTDTLQRKLATLTSKTNKLGEYCHKLPSDDGVSIPRLIVERTKRKLALEPVRPRKAVGPGTPPIYPKPTHTSSLPRPSARSPFRVNPGHAGHTSDADSVQTEDFERQFKGLMVGAAGKAEESDLESVSNDPIHTRVKQLLKATSKYKPKPDYKSKPHVDQKSKPHVDYKSKPHVRISPRPVQIQYDDKGEDSDDTLCSEKNTSLTAYRRWGMWEPFSSWNNFSDSYNRQWLGLQSSPYQRQTLTSPWSDDSFSKSSSISRSSNSSSEKEISATQNITKMLRNGNNTLLLAGEESNLGDLSKPTSQISNTTSLSMWSGSAELPSRPASAPGYASTSDSMFDDFTVMNRDNEHGKTFKDYQYSNSIGPTRRRSSLSDSLSVSPYSSKQSNEDNMKTMKEKQKNHDIIIQEDEEEDYPFAKYTFNKKKGDDSTSTISSMSTRSNSQESIYSVGMMQQYDTLKRGKVPPLMNKHSSTSSMISSITSSFADPNAIDMSVEDSSSSQEYEAFNQEWRMRHPNKLSQNSRPNLFLKIPSERPPTPVQNPYNYQMYNYSQIPAPNPEQMLNNLGLNEARSILPERFLKSWIEKALMTQQDEYLRSMMTAQSPQLAPSNYFSNPYYVDDSDLLPSVSAQQSEVNTPQYPQSLDNLHDIAKLLPQVPSRLPYKRTLLRSRTFNSSGQSFRSDSGSFLSNDDEDVALAKVGALPVVKENSFDKLKRILHKSGHSPYREKTFRRSMFAANHQKSLPIFLETLSEEEEEKRRSRTPSFDNNSEKPKHTSNMRTFLEEECTSCHTSSSEHNFDLSYQSSICGTRGESSKDQFVSSNSVSNSDNSEIDYDESSSLHECSVMKIPCIIVSEKEVDFETSNEEIDGNESMLPSVVEDSCPQTNSVLMQRSRPVSPNPNNQEEHISFNSINSSEVAYIMPAKEKPVLSKCSNIVTDSKDFEHVAQESVAKTSQFLSISLSDIDEKFLSPCSSIASPNIMSPITVIEVSKLDNQDDSLELDEATVTDCRGTGQSSSGTTESKAQLELQTNKNQDSVCNQSYDQNKASRIYQAPKCLMLRRHWKHSGNYCRESASKLESVVCKGGLAPHVAEYQTAEIQVDDNTLPPIIKMSSVTELLEHLLQSFPEESGGSMFYLAHDQSTQCDLLKDGTLNDTITYQGDVLEDATPHDKVTYQCDLQKDGTHKDKMTTDCDSQQDGKHHNTITDSKKYMEKVGNVAVHNPLIKFCSMSLSFTELENDYDANTTTVNINNSHALTDEQFIEQSVDAGNNSVMCETLLESLTKPRKTNNPTEQVGCNKRFVHGSTDEIVHPSEIYRTEVFILGQSSKSRTNALQNNNGQNQCDLEYEVVSNENKAGKTTLNETQRKDNSDEIAGNGTPMESSPCENTTCNETQTRTNSGTIACNEKPREKNSCKIAVNEIPRKTISGNTATSNGPLLSNETQLMLIESIQPIANGQCLSSEILEDASLQDKVTSQCDLQKDGTHKDKMTTDCDLQQDGSLNDTMKPECDLQPDGKLNDKMTTVCDLQQEGKLHNTITDSNKHMEKVGNAVVHNPLIKFCSMSLSFAELENEYDANTTAVNINDSHALSDEQFIHQSIDAGNNLVMCETWLQSLTKPRKTNNPTEQVGCNKRLVHGSTDEIVHSSEIFRTEKVFILGQSSESRANALQNNNGQNQCDLEYEDVSNENKADTTTLNETQRKDNSDEIAGNGTPMKSSPCNNTTCNETQNRNNSGTITCNEIPREKNSCKIAVNEIPRKTISGNTCTATYNGPLLSNETELMFIESIQPIDNGQCLTSEIQENKHDAMRTERNCITEIVDRLDLRKLSAGTVLVEKKGADSEENIKAYKKEIGFLHAGKMFESDEITDPLYSLFETGSVHRYKSTLSLKLNSESRAACADVSPVIEIKTCNKYIGVKKISVGCKNDTVKGLESRSDQKMCKNMEISGPSNTLEDGTEDEIGEYESKIQAVDRRTASTEVPLSVCYSECTRYPSMSLLHCHNNSQKSMNSHHDSLKETYVSNAFFKIQLPNIERRNSVNPKDFSNKHFRCSQDSIDNVSENVHKEHRIKSNMCTFNADSVQYSVPNTYFAHENEDVRTGFDSPSRTLVSRVDIDVDNKLNDESLAESKRNGNRFKELFVRQKSMLEDGINTYDSQDTILVEFNKITKQTESKAKYKNNSLLEKCQAWLGSSNEESNINSPNDDSTGTCSINEGSAAKSQIISGRSLDFETIESRKNILQRCLNAEFSKSFDIGGIDVIDAKHDIEDSLSQTLNFEIEDCYYDDAYGRGKVINDNTVGSLELGSDVGDLDGMESGMNRMVDLSEAKYMKAMSKQMQGHGNEHPTSNIISEIKKPKKGCFNEELNEHSDNKNNTVINLDINVENNVADMNMLTFEGMEKREVFDMFEQVVDDDVLMPKCEISAQSDYPNDEKDDDDNHQDDNKTKQGPDQTNQTLDNINDDDATRQRFDKTKHTTDNINDAEQTNQAVAKIIDDDMTRQTLDEIERLYCLTVCDQASISDEFKIEMSENEHEDSNYIDQETKFLDSYYDAYRITETHICSNCGHSVTLACQNVSTHIIKHDFCHKCSPMNLTTDMLERRRTQRVNIYDV